MSINDGSRLVSQGSGTLSDTAWLTSTTKWVRFIGASGTELATYTYGVNTCGTTYTGYYTSSLPSPSETVAGTVCFYVSATYPCYYLYAVTILVTNCGSYYVYGLTSPPLSSARYCTM